MRALSEQEKQFVEVLLKDEATLINFFRDTDSPLFIQALLGENSEKRNIFKEECGEPANGRSKFSWQIYYLYRAAQRLEKEKISPQAKQEYLSYVLQAVKIIMKGVLNEKNVQDIQAVSQLIQTLDVLGPDSCDDDVTQLINTYIAQGFSGLVIYSLLPLIKKLLDRKDKRGGAILLELMRAVPGRGDYRSIYDYLKDFLNEGSLIHSVAQICDEEMIMQIAQGLIERLRFEAKHPILDKIVVTVLPDTDIRVEIVNTDIVFTLPNVALEDKEKKICPIIEEKLQDYKGEDKQQIMGLIYHSYTYVWHDITYITYPSLFNPLSSYLSNQAQAVFIYVLKEMLRCVIQNKGLEKFNALYQQITRTHKNFILKRILLYCYATNFQLCRHEVFSLLEREKSLLFSLYFEAEIYGLCSTNVKQFTTAEIQFLDELIQKGPYEETDWLEPQVAQECNTVESKLMWQQGRYAALKEHPYFNTKYNEVYAQTQRREFFNFRDSRAKFITYKPVFPDEIAVKRIVEDPRSFIYEIEQKEKEHPKRFEFSDEVPCAEGNIEQMYRLGKNFPKQMAVSVCNLLPLKPAYIRHLLYGLGEAPDLQDISWDHLFKFIREYLAKCPQQSLTEEQVSSFFIVPPQEERSYIMRAFARIIPESLNRSSMVFEQAIALLEEFLRELLPQYAFQPRNCGQPLKKEAMRFSYFHLSIATFMGAILEKYISLCLRQGKAAAPRLQTMMDVLFEKQVVEAYLFLGFYFAYFQDVLPEWASQKAQLLLASSSSEPQDLWEVFFEGFIKSQRQHFEYYDEMYGHYKYAIELYKTEEVEGLSNMLLQFLLGGKDRLDYRSLLLCCYHQEAFPILSESIQMLVHQISRYLFEGATLSEEENQEKREAVEKARELWTTFRECIKEEQSALVLASNPQRATFLKGLLKLMSVIDVMSCADYNFIQLIIQTNSWKNEEISGLLKHLDLVLQKQENEGVVYGAKIYDSMIENLDYILFPAQHEQIVRTLVVASQQEEVKNILVAIKDKYTKRGWNWGLTWFNQASCS